MRLRNPPAVAGADSWLKSAGCYGIAIAAAVAAVLIRLWLLEPLLGTGNSYLQSYPAILLATWICGLTGGLLATATSSVAIWYLVLPPEAFWGVAATADRVALVVFVGIGTLISVLLDRQQEFHRIARESEERYRSLVELSPDAMFVVAGNRIAYVNASTVRLLGAAEASDIIGRSPFEFIAGGSQDLARGRMAHLLSGGKRVPPVEQEWVRVDGRALPVEVTAARVPWGNGEAIQVLFRDVSERRQADREREALLEQAEAARAQAEQANRLKEEFLAVLSHELRTPLNAVLGWARIIKGSMTRQDRLDHALTVIERNASAQVQIVEDLLDVSRIVTGQFQLQMQRTDFRQAVAHATDSIRPTAAAKEIALNLTLPEEEVPVMGDPGRLQQTCWNLLSNAVKFTPRGGLVNVTMRRIGAEVELMVSDTGVGISPDFLPFVFDRFRQQDSGSTRTARGLGLGLSLVRHLVDAHGGQVHASSLGVGSGSTFVVTLPLTTAAAADERPNAAARPLEQTPASREAR